MLAFLKALFMALIPVLIEWIQDKRIEKKGEVVTDADRKQDDRDRLRAALTHRDRGELHALLAERKLRKDREDASGVPD